MIERVRPVKDLDVLVRRPGRTVPNADLILRIAQEEVNNWAGRIDRRVEELRDLAGNGKVPLLKELEQMILSDKANQPIILVPCNKNAPVNLLNASALLQEGAYHVLDEEKVKFCESTRPEMVEIVRNINNKLWTCEVRDTTKSFTKSQWLRVVAVIIDGVEWQLKGWPFETVVDLFATVKGVYFNEVGNLPPQHIKGWRVDVLQMSPVQFQHRFRELRDAFWKGVESFLREARIKKYVNHTTLQPDKRIVIKSLPVL